MLVILIAVAVLLLIGGGAAAYVVVHNVLGSPVAAGASLSSGATVGVATSRVPSTFGLTPAQAPPPGPVATDTGTSETGQVAAELVNGVLDDSARARSGVQPVLDRIASCEGDGSEVKALQNAASIRRDLIAQLTTLDLSGINGAPSLKTTLTNLLTDSAKADDEYVQWGYVNQGCTNQAGAGVYKKRGDQFSVKATADKKVFAREWNAVAGRYDLPPRNPAGL